MRNDNFNFIKKYEELLDKGYCDCNEMNCIDNNSPRRILNIVKDLQRKLDNIEFYIEQSNIKNMLWGKEILKIIGGNDD